MTVDSKRTPFEDDGRTIVSMDVEGMPWHGPDRGGPQDKGETLSPRETRQAIFAALKAALAVAAVISLGLVLFVLFCTEIWFQ